MAARSIASATISFGLVAIPVKLYTPIRSSGQIRFNQLGPDGARVKQQYVSSKSGEVVPRSEMQKGYEFAKGQYVTFSKEELKAMEATSTGAVDIREFVAIDQVDPLYYQKAYYLAPDKGGAKPYQLLAQAMRDTSMVGIGKYAARGKDYLVMVRPVEQGLILEQLYYADEIRGFDEIPVDEADVAQGELKLAKQLIDQVASEEFKPDSYEDSVRARMEDMIEQKVAGEEITVAPDEGEAGGRVIDLMEALKSSLEEERKPAKRAQGKKTASKKKKTRKKKAG